MSALTGDTVTADKVGRLPQKPLIRKKSHQGNEYINMIKWFINLHKMVRKMELQIAMN